MITLNSPSISAIPPITHGSEISTPGTRSSVAPVAATRLGTCNNEPLTSSPHKFEFAPMAAKISVICPAISAKSGVKPSITVACAYHEANVSNNDAILNRGKTHISRSSTIGNNIRYARRPKSRNPADKLSIIPNDKSVSLLAGQRQGLLLPSPLVDGRSIKHNFYARSIPQHR